MLNLELARQRREALNLTQVQLAELLGVDHSTLSYWETGGREPRRSDQLIAWARALGLEPGDLLAEPDQAEPDQAGAVTARG